MVIKKRDLFERKKHEMMENAQKRSKDEVNQLPKTTLYLKVLSCFSSIPCLWGEIIGKKKAKRGRRNITRVEKPKTKRGIWEKGKQTVAATQRVY